MTQRTQFLPEQVVDVSTQSWQDILASVASEMGVLDDSEYNSSTAESQQPVRTSSQPLDAGANQREEGLHAESVASTLNLMTSNGHGFPSHMTGADIQANTPVQTTQTLYHLNYDSSLGPHEAHLDGVSPLGIFQHRPASNCCWLVSPRRRVSCVQSIFQHRLVSVDFDLLKKE
jgi:hypothetical protein